MSKLVLSGDLGHFRVEMLVRILESIRINAEVSFEGPDKGQIYFVQGKIVGANTATDQGVSALSGIAGLKTGTFSVRLSEDPNRHPDLLQFPDNQSIFRHLPRIETTTGRWPRCVTHPATSAIKSWRPRLRISCRA